MAGWVGRLEAYLQWACDDYAHYQRRQVGQTAAALCGHRAPSPGLPAHITLVSLPFHVIFFIPKKKIFFKSLKKKRHIKHANTWTQQANTEMWTLHVDIRAQRQALGNVCVHSLHVRVRACVCACVELCVSMLLHSQCSLCVRVWERVRDLTVGFPSIQYMLFPSFFGIGQMFSLLLFASNFALRCPCPSVS